MNLTPFSTGFMAVHWIVVVLLSIRVIGARLPVAVSVAWLAVISSVPFVGAVAYLMTGETRLGIKRRERILGVLGELIAWQGELRERARRTGDCPQAAGAPTASLAERLLGFPVLGGNRVELVSGFDRSHEAIVADIEAAERSCGLSFYIWQEGGREELVADALVRAARRGVACRVLVDALASRRFLAGERARRLREAGVAVSAALPGGPIRTFFVRRDLRYHRKLIVVDDRVAWTGSQNLVDPRLFKTDLGVGEWIDCMARVTGPAAAALAALSRLDWAVEARVPCELPPLPDLCDPTRRVEGLAGEGSCIQVVPSGPQPQPEAIYMLVLEAIYTARRELTITTPYFVPDETVVVALRSAALRGVRVRLVVPKRNDSFMADQAGRSNFGPLMEAGVEIHLFDGGLLHTKSVTIDGTTGVFGSVNLDARSLRLNFELSLFVHDAELTGRLAALQAEYVGMSCRVDPEAWAARPAGRRLTEGLMRLLSPLL